MSDPMRIRAVNTNGVTEVRVLMAHPMETGQRRDSAGQVIPGHFITEVTAVCNGKTVLSAIWGPAISQNPFLQFRFAGANKGDKLVITWTDNKGVKRTDEAVIG
jgi:sulfur-oxidizing protein SoxZ